LSLAGEERKKGSGGKKKMVQKKKGREKKGWLSEHNLHVPLSRKPHEPTGRREKGKKRFKRGKEGRDIPLGAFAQSTHLPRTLPLLMDEKKGGSPKKKGEKRKEPAVIGHYHYFLLISNHDVFEAIWRRKRGTKTRRTISPNMHRFQLAEAEKGKKKLTKKGGEKKWEWEKSEYRTGFVTLAF